MENFLINVEYDSFAGGFKANYASGASVLLGSNTYSDAVCEADLIDLDEVE